MRKRGEYIENGCEQPSDSDSDDSDEVTDTEATNPKKDLSQRPDHYKTMKAEVLVVHDCDKDKLAGRTLEDCSSRRVVTTRTPWHRHS